jgi:predicted permease
MDSRMMGVPDSILRILSTAVLLAVGVVMLVACTNLAHLMLARNGRRRAEMGVRAALGASRAQLVRSALAEPIWLVAVGGLLGLTVARVFMRALGAGVELNGWTLQAQPVLDVASLGASLVSVAFVLLVSGVWPAWRATRVDVRTVVASDTAASSPRWRGRRYLIALQVMVSVVLVFIAALQTSELRRQGRVDWGVDLDRLAIAEIDLASHGYDLGRARPLVGAILARLERRPGVQSAAAVSSLPTTASDLGFVSVPGQSASARVRVVAATPGTLETMGVVLSRGRSVQPEDTAAAPPVLVISDSSARAAFGSTDPIGRQVILRQGEGSTSTSRTLTIIGIADARAGSLLARQNLIPVAYVAMDQSPSLRFVIAARTIGRPAGLLAEVRQAISEADRDVAASRLGTGLAVAGPVTIFYEVVAWLSSSLGGLALLIALAGLYGVLSHLVTGRAREIGVRLALGADAGRIRRMLVVEGLSPVTMGLAAGGVLILVSRLASRAWMPQLLPQVDPWLIVLAATIVLLAGYAAVYLPARRASRVDPNVALRAL